MLFSSKKALLLNFSFEQVQCRNNLVAAESSLMIVGLRPWRRGLVVSSPPATEETGAMGREIGSLRGKGW
jgi:hypothetical protein